MVGWVFEWSDVGRRVEGCGWKDVGGRVVNEIDVCRWTILHHIMLVKFNKA